MWGDDSEWFMPLKSNAVIHTHITRAMRRMTVLNPDRLRVRRLEFAQEFRENSPRECVGAG